MFFFKVDFVFFTYVENQDLKEDRKNHYLLTILTHSERFRSAECKVLCLSLRLFLPHEGQEYRFSISELMKVLKV